MAFGDAILNLIGNKDPRLALLTAMQGGTPATPDAAGATPAGVGMAGGGAAPAQPAPPPQPAVYQSPPELMQLYTQLLDRQRKASMIDRGIGMIGASLAFPENRAGIMQAFGGGGGSGGGAEDPMTFIQGITQFQQQQMQLQQKAAMRAALPAIANQYGIDLQTAQYLFDTGKLDSVIAEAEKPNKQIVQQSDGTHTIVDLSSGQVSDPFGVPKRREIELVEDPITGGKIAVYSDTKERVGNPDLDMPGSGNTADEKLWRADEADRKERGLPSRPLTEFIDATSRSRAGASNLGASGIDYGNPPTDMAWSRDAQGNVNVDENGAPIPVPLQNSKLAAEREAAAAKEENLGEQRSTTAGVVIDEIDFAKKLIEDNADSWFPVTGITGKVVGLIPNTPHYDFNEAIETVKANIGFDKLQEMRNASPTGGALGQVSDFENRLLQATMGSLDTGQRRDTLIRRLDRIQGLYDKVNAVLTAPDMATAERRARELDRDLADVERNIRRRTDTQPEPEASGADTPIDGIMKKYGG